MVQSALRVPGILMSSGSGGGSSTPNGLGEKITPVGLNKYWRKNTGQTFNMTIPTGYTCNWTIYESETFSLFSSGTGTSINATFTVAMLSYDVVVTVTKGTLQFERWFRRAITVLPPTFTEAQADAVWDLASGAFVWYKDNNLVNRTGYKIYVKGIATVGTYLGLEEWVSTLADQPVHFLFAPGSVTEIRTSNAFCMRINQNCQNILIDGCGDPTVPYGLKLSMPGTGSRAQPVVMETATNAGSTPSTAGKNIWFCGVEIDGNGISSAGIKVDTANSATVNYDQYLATGLGALTGLHIMDVLVHNTVDEGYYIGYVSDSPHGSPSYASAPIVNARIVRCIAKDTGGDGHQYGAALFGADIHGCLADNAGTRNDPSHKNSYQFSSGNRDCFLYQCEAKNGKNLFTIATGRAGSNAEIFSNKFQLPSVAMSNFFIRVDQNDTFANFYYKLYNNTLVLADGIPFSYWNATASPVVTTKLNTWNVDNLITSNTTTQYNTFNGINTSGWVIANYQVTSTATPQFVNVGAGDYHLASLASPAFRPRTVITKGHPLSNYDFEGVKFVIDVAGCYSGYELMT